jgi:hypothetical protein
LCAAGTRRSPPLTAEELVRLRDLWVDGVPVNDIIAEFRFGFDRLHSLIALLGLPAKRHRALWVPSQTEIAVEAAKIRSGWSEDERLYRARHITDPLPESFYLTLDDPDG